MDFFEHQAEAKQALAEHKTWLLILLLALAIVGILVTLHLIFAFLFFRPLNDPLVFINVSFGVAVVVVIGSAWRIDGLSGGGHAVASMLGGKPVCDNTTNLNERKLFQVVEQTAHALGVPVPAIYVLPERTINAFAAGYGPSDAVIGVTRGCIEHLERDELQSVIAHEFSHIVHGDMRLNIRLMGLLAGILGLSIAGRLLMATGGMIKALGAPVYVVGFIGVFFATLIKVAINRQREFQADAFAVQFAGEPQALARALWKIGVLRSRLSSPYAEEASHMFFSNGLSDWWSGIIGTHPPLIKRIKAVDPSFDSSLLAQLRAELERTEGGRRNAKMPILHWISLLVAGGIVSFFGYEIYTTVRDLRALDAEWRQELSARKPGTRAPGYFKGQELYRAHRVEGNADGMLKLSELALKEAPDSVEEQYAVARLLLVTGREIERAGRLARELYESAPKNRDYAVLYAFSLHLQGDSAKAAALLESRKDLRKLDNEQLSYCVLILSGCGRGGEARTIMTEIDQSGLLPELREALDHAVRQPSIEAGADTASILGRFDGAGRLPKELYESNPRSLDHAVVYAFNLHLQGDSAAGANLLESRSDLDKMNDEQLSYYALILSGCRRGSEARKILKGVDRSGLSPEVRDALDRAVGPASAETSAGAPSGKTR